MKSHKLVEVNRLGASFVKHTIVQNVVPYFFLPTHKVIDNGLLITSLVSIVPIKSSGDVGVIVPFPSF